MPNDIELLQRTQICPVCDDRILAATQEEVVRRHDELSVFQGLLYGAGHQRIFLRLLQDIFDIVHLTLPFELREAIVQHDDRIGFLVRIELKIFLDRLQLFFHLFLLCQQILMRCLKRLVALQEFRDLLVLIGRLDHALQVTMIPGQCQTVRCSVRRLYFSTCCFDRASLSLHCVRF